MWGEIGNVAYEKESDTLLITWLSPCSLGLGVVGTSIAFKLIAEDEHLASIGADSKRFFHAVAEKGGLIFVAFRVYLQEEIDFGVRMSAIAGTEHLCQFVVREEEIGRIFALTYMPAHAHATGLARLMITE